MKKLLLLLLIPFFATAQETKTSKIVNPDGNWYFGVEIGSNKITSYILGEPNKSIQGGILAEYYTGRHWSLTGRIKYYKTGLSFHKAGSSGGSGFFSLSSPTEYGQFDGAVISLPINIKWEFRLYKNFSGNLNFGLNYNFETKSDYNYSDDKNKNFNKKYLGSSSGLGFNYFLSKKIAVFLNFDYYLGSIKGKSSSLIGDSRYYTTNKLVNFGFKYNFKKEKI